MEPSTGLVSGRFLLLHPSDALDRRRVRRMKRRRNENDLGSSPATKRLTFGGSFSNLSFVASGRRLFPFLSFLLHGLDHESLPTMEAERKEKEKGKVAGGCVASGWCVGLRPVGWFLIGR